MAAQGGNRIGARRLPRGDERRGEGDREHRRTARGERSRVRRADAGTDVIGRAPASVQDVARGRAFGVC
jgi:hypothetical protein